MARLRRRPAARRARVERQVAPGHQPELPAGLIHQHLAAVDRHRAPRRRRGRAGGSAGPSGRRGRSPPRPGGAASVERQRVLLAAAERGGVDQQVEARRGRGRRSGRKGTCRRSAELWPRSGSRLNIVTRAPALVEPLRRRAPRAAGADHRRLQSLDGDAAVAQGEHDAVRIGGLRLPDPLVAHQRVGGADQAGERALRAATASAASLNGAVTERPRMGARSPPALAFSITSSQKSPNESAWNGR